MKDERTAAGGAEPLSPRRVVAAVAGGVYDWFRDPARLTEGRMSAALAPYEALFEPIRINRLELRNRIVMGPMGNVGMAEPMGRPGDRMIAYYAERASGGVGLIVSGMTPVSWRADPSYAEPGGLSLFPRLDGSRACFSGWKLLAEAIHAHGSRFFVQLAPGMGRVGSPECLLTKGRLPVSASWNPNWYMPKLPCRPLTDLEIRRLIRRTGRVAADLKELGIDGVAIHGHSGYLVEQLTDGAYNRRLIGCYADKKRFGLELVRAVRDACGSDYPILYRLDLSAALRETYGERLDEEPALRRFRSGRTAEESLAYVEALVAEGVDAIDVDLGGYENWWLPHPPNGMPPGVYLACARLVKERLAASGLRSRSGASVPVIAVGKLGFPDLAEGALRSGAADMVLLARALLADPEWPNKVRSGRIAEIRPCIGDHEGCLGQLATGGTPHCAVNPRATFEHKLPRVPVRSERPRRVAVIGAGPAGIAAAGVLARRGHSVVLFEARDRIGGMLVPGARPAIKYELRNYLAWIEDELERAASTADLELRLGTRVGAEDLAESDFEAVFACVGGRPLVPRVAGVSGPGVVQAVDLLREPSLLGGARRVLVVGGSDVGCETASWLALELGCKVTLIEALPELMPRSCQANRGYLIRQLDRAGVRLSTLTRLVAIEPGKARVERFVDRLRPLGERGGACDPTVTWRPILAPNVPNPFSHRPRGHWEPGEIDAELVVLACGLLPEAETVRMLAKAARSADFRALGDCERPGRVLEAVQAGYAAGLVL